MWSMEARGSGQQNSPNIPFDTSRTTLVQCRDHAIAHIAPISSFLIPLSVWRHPFPKHDDITKHKAMA